MVEIKVTGNTPLEALSSLTAFATHCMSNKDVWNAANRILEAEQHEERKKAAAQAAEKAPDFPKDYDVAPADPPGPAAGETGPTAAPSENAAPAPAPLATPTKSGDANGLRKRSWNTPPQSPRLAPAVTPIKTLGRRRVKNTFSPISPAAFPEITLRISGSERG